MKRRAFTLAEMLIVLGIIAVLVGFLLVVTRKGGEAARKVTCASNLRQLAAAFTSYAQDNEGRFPGAAEIFQTLREDWIYLDDPRGTFRPLQGSALAKYLG
jgi:prepilin-type N-terminal cleavage/methylation domain-containing protein